MRMKKRTENILLGVGITVSAAAVFTAVSYLATHRLVGVALDRVEPKVGTKSKARLTGNKKVEEALLFQKKVAQRLENANLERVTLTAQDGTSLVGHYYEAPFAERTLVCMHGWRSSWSRDFGMFADFLFSQRCNILFAEQRGQGQSGGDYMGFGLTERFDCLDWVHWVQERAGGECPIYLVGISMGATTVLMTAGFDLPAQVRGIIADCGFTSPHEIWRHVAKNMRLLYNSWRGNVASAICKKKIKVGSDSYSTMDAMKLCDVPVLFIHGTDDKFVPIEMTYANYKACSAPKQLLIVPGAEHGMSYVVARELYESAVQDFWAKYDTI